MASNPSFQWPSSIKSNPLSGNDDNSATNNNDPPPPAAAPHDPKLDHYETLLAITIDPDSFAPLEQFHTLLRAIAILGRASKTAGASPPFLSACTVAMKCTTH
eukprot:CCRYP_002309-RA/>CCRYP_002309-RA protein AED:0.08 eAED:0.08 QI:0/-1/0/1/-1/1/1/0/102